MTIVVALKVGDGLVLGADSASTLAAGNVYKNSYFNAEKLFHLAKTLPLGLLTFGLGGLAGRSISSHLKDLRLAIADQASPMYLDPAIYTVKEAAERVSAWFFNGLYATEYEGSADRPTLGFIVAGYSAGAPTGEIWRVTMGASGAIGPVPIVPLTEKWGADWDGQPEVMHRLIWGWSPQILGRLVEAGLTEEVGRKLLNSAQPMVHETMPLKDAIDLVDYLLETTCGFVRFAPGHPTVAKPIDTAAITRYEGFRWIHRKHYYPRELNLPHPPGCP